MASRRSVERTVPDITQFGYLEWRAAASREPQYPRPPIKARVGGEDLVAVVVAVDGDGGTFPEDARSTERSGIDRFIVHCPCRSACTSCMIHWMWHRCAVIRDQDRWVYGGVTWSAVPRVSKGGAIFRKLEGNSSEFEERRRSSVVFAPVFLSSVEDYLLFRRLINHKKFLPKHNVPNSKSNNRSS